MKIDQQYLKNLLIAFEDTEGPDTLLEELESAGYNRDDPNFVFHMRLLYDNGLIVRTDGEQGFGHQYRSYICLLYTSPSPRDQRGSRMPSSA